jgi:hypothetical protein
MVHDLEALRVAPVVDAYTGPAILSGRTSGVFFHEIFGHRVEEAAPEKLHRCADVQAKDRRAGAGQGLFGVFRSD